jgi:hypothetical protein
VSLLHPTDFVSSMNGLKVVCSRSSVSTLLMMLNRLCVMTMTMNQMSTPHLFFDNSNPGE